MLVLGYSIFRISNMVTHFKPPRTHLRHVKKVKEADLYSAFIEVPYTHGAQVRLRYGMVKVWYKDRDISLYQIYTAW